jgi:two-component system, NtrC family, nitrogen regulation sensor histidine kinase GlnL
VQYCENMNDLMKTPGSLIENINTAVLVFDKDLCLVSINAAGENLLSVSINKIAGHKPDEILLGSTRFNENLKRTLLKMRSYTDWGVDLILNNQRTITVGCMVTPIIDDDNHKQVIVELIDSESFTRAMREETSLAVYDAARKSLKGIAHEIKNPLGGLRGAAQLLERELKEQGLTEYTQIIIKEADRLRSLVDRMLAHESRPHLSDVNLHEVLEYVIDLANAEESTELKIFRDYDPSLPGLRGDKDQLIQAFINIIQNAVQAIATNGQIWIRTRVKRQFTVRQNFHKLVAQIDIIDDGPGIPEEIEREVFYPLVTGRADGTGLGLSIAQSLIQVHGGLVSYGRKNEKTIFKVLLPLNQGDD